MSVLHIGSTGTLGTFTVQDAPCIWWPMVAKPQRDAERIVTPMPAKLVERIDDFRWTHRLPSRAAAIRQLVEAGLEAKGGGAQDRGKRKS
jgi:hypothetical protein